MGNYFAVPSSWLGGGASSPESEFKTHAKSDEDVVQLVEWLESQKVDFAKIEKIEKMICDLWKKHEETLRSDAYEALQYTLKTKKSYAEMQSAINKLVDERKIAIMADVEDNIGSKQASFHVNLDAISKSIAAVMGAAGAGPIGAIMVALLDGIKEVDFYKEECTTKGKRSQTLGIIDIVWDDHDDDGDGTVLFELAKLEVEMVNEKKETVFIGGKKVIVQISYYYGKMSMHLRNFMPPDDRKKLKLKLNAANSNKKIGFKI